MMKIIVCILLIGAVILSIRTRVKMMMWRSPEASDRLAKAIAQLVGTAGGIYLSLELLLTFLGIPEQYWDPPSFYFFKPLAVFSLLIAILQPYVIKLFKYFRDWRKQ